MDFRDRLGYVPVGPACVLMKMQRAFIFSLVFLRAIGGGCASRRSHDASSFSNGSAGCACGLTNWFKFAPAGGAFSVLMPSTPKVEIKTNTAAGPTVFTSWLAEPSRLQAFSVVNYRYPQNFIAANQGKILELMIQASLRNDGTLHSEKKIRHQGYAGREWKITIVNDKATLVQRAYLVGSDVYVLMSIMPATQFCEKHASEFLNSLTLTGTQLQSH